LVPNAQAGATACPRPGVCGGRCLPGLVHGGRHVRHRPQLAQVGVAGDHVGAAPVDLVGVPPAGPAPVALVGVPPAATAEVEHAVTGPDREAAEVDGQHWSCSPVRACSPVRSWSPLPACSAAPLCCPVWSCPPGRRWAAMARSYSATVARATADQV